MPEPAASTPSPPLQQESSSPVSIALSSIIIIVSVAFLAWAANLTPAPETEQAVMMPAGEGVLVSPEEANELAMLKMQSRIFISLAQIDGSGVKRNLSQLEELAGTSRGQGALAIVYRFIYQDEDLENALAYLDDVDSKEPWLDDLRSGLANGVTDTDRAELENAFGWFSKLIPPAEGNDSTDYRQEIQTESAKTLMVCGGLVGLIILAFIGGLVALIFLLVKRSERSETFRFNPCASPGKKHLFLEAFAIYIGIMAAGQLFGLVSKDVEALTPYAALVAYACYGLSFILALFWPKIRGSSWKECRDLMGWNRGAGFFKEIGAGMLGYLMIVVFAAAGLIMVLSITLVTNLIKGDGDSAESLSSGGHPIVGMLDSTDSVWAKVLLLVLAAVMAPLLEETMFRGALYRFFRHSWGFLLSAVIGGVIFAIIHPQGWIAVPALGAMGAGFALLREWRDSLIASMTAHAINNGVIVGFILLAL